MEEALQQLANLQYIDSRIDELKQLRGDLPEEIEDIKTDILREEMRFTALEQEEKSLVVENSQLKLDHASAEEKIQKYEDQQLSVRNNREYDALTKEVEVQKQVVKNSIARLEEVEKRLEEIKPELESAAGNLEVIQKKLEEKSGSLDMVIQDTQDEEDVLLKKREEIIESMDKNYLRSYNRLRNGISNGIAVVAMDRGAALGMALPPQTQVEVRRKNKIITDESSGRIVVDASFFKKAKEQLSAI